MASYNSISDTEVDPESPITTSLMTRMRDNPIAIAQGATGAPRVTGRAGKGSVAGADRFGIVYQGADLSGNVTLKPGDSVLVSASQVLGVTLPVDMVAGSQYRVIAHMQNGPATNQDFFLRVNSTAYVDEFSRMSTINDGTLSSSATSTESHFRFGQFRSWGVLDATLHYSSSSDRKLAVSNVGADRDNAPRLIQTNYGEWTNPTASWDTMGDLEFAGGLWDWYITIIRVH